MSNLTEDIKFFIYHFKEQSTIIYSASFSAYEKQNKKILFMCLIDALSQTYKGKNHREQFVEIIKKFSGWKDFSKVSLPHLNEFLKKYPDDSFAALRKYCSEKMINWQPGDLINLDKEPDITEINTLWPDEYKKIKIDSKEISVDSFSHAQLLYSYRNTLVHEFREAGYGIGSRNIDEPHYHAMYGPESDSYTWEMVYSVNFFKKISDEIIVNLEQYYIKNKINPYSKYEFGTYFLALLNAEGDFEKYVKFNTENIKRSIFDNRFDALIKKTLLKLKNKFKNPRLAALASLFMKAEQTYKACRLLLKSSFIKDGEALTRVLYEEMLKIGYCSIGDNEYQSYLASEVEHSRRAVNSLICHPEEVPDEFNELINKNLLQECKKNLDEKYDCIEFKSVSLETMARELDKKNIEDDHVMMKLYNAYYRTVCNVVHTNPNALMPYLIFEDDGSIFLNPDFKSDRSGPELASIDFMLTIIKYISESFNFSFEDEISNLNLTKTFSFNRAEN
jgi:hypothetical protein